MMHDDQATYLDVLEFRHELEQPPEPTLDEVIAWCEKTECSLSVWPSEAGWQAITQMNRHREYGDGDTPRAALLAAYAKAKEGTQ